MSSLTGAATLKFPEGDREKADFWAWLTDGCVLTLPVKDAKEDSTPVVELVVVSREYVRGLIDSALEQNDQLQVDELLRVASTPQHLAKDIARKSVRVRSGEYVKLLYVKLAEKGSFSDVIMKLVRFTAQDFVKDLQRRYQNNPPVSRRISHLLSIIETWEKPESRTKNVDPGGSLDEPDWIKSGSNIPESEELRLAVADYALAGIERKYSGRWNQAIWKLYEAEFRPTWRDGLRASIPKGMGLKPGVNPVNSDTVLFVPLMGISEAPAARRVEKLYNIYGRDEVLRFFNSFHTEEGGQREVNKYYDAETGAFLDSPSFYVDVELPTCVATVKTPDHVVVECPSQPTDILSREDREMWELTKAVAKKLGLDAYRYFAIEKEKAPKFGVLSGELIANTKAFSDLIRLANKNATTADDFAEIRRLMKYKATLGGYEKARDYLTEIVDRTLRDRSVISFYIPVDMWRLLPLLLTDKSWIQLANDYLASTRPKRDS